MGINLGAISAKLDSYVKSPAGKQRINNKMQELRSGVRSGNGAPGKTQAGDAVITYEQMQEAAESLVAMIRKHAASNNLPASVMGNIESFAASDIAIADDGSAHIAINLTSDAHRESLRPDIPKFARGSDNIVAAFNAGYEADGTVFGLWNSKGEEVWSLRTRKGLYFLQEAINEFNSKYAEKYKVTVSLDSQYE